MRVTVVAAPRNRLRSFPAATAFALCARKGWTPTQAPVPAIARTAYATRPAPRFEHIAAPGGDSASQARALTARMDAAAEPEDAGEAGEGVDLVDTPPHGRHTPPPR